MKGNSVAMISWEKISKSKRDGGLGMSDLSAFNTTLLSKQFRRLATNPQSFASMVQRVNSSQGAWFGMLQPPPPPHTQASHGSQLSLLKS